MCSDIMSCYYINYNSYLWMLFSISFLQVTLVKENYWVVQDYKVNKLTLQSQPIDLRHLTKICLHKLFCHIS